MKPIALALIVALSTACGSAGAYRSAQTSFAASQVLDITSTRAVIANGGHEANALLTNSLTRQVLIKGAASTLILAAAAKVRRDGHPRASTVLLTALSVAYGLIVARNYNLSRELDGRAR